MKPIQVNILCFLIGCAVIGAIWYGSQHQANTEPYHSEYLKLIAAEKDKGEDISIAAHKSDSTHKVFEAQQAAIIQNFKNQISNQQYELHKRFKYYDTVSIFVLDGFLARSYDSLAVTRFAE